MGSEPLGADDVALFQRARDVLARHFHPTDHQVAAAVRTTSGAVFVGLHLGSRRVNVCAEASAIANAVMSSDGARIASVVAVCKDLSGRIVVTNPCGVCRELMTNYASDATVIVDVRGRVEAVPAAHLLPEPWLTAPEVPWTVEEPRVGA